MQKIFTVLILILLIFLACEPEEVLPEFEADFVMSAETIEVGDTIAFGEKVQGFPASFRWLFEGGQPSISNEKKQTVSYRSKGTFKVTLWVESEDAREDSVVKEITVTEGLKAQFTAPKTIIRQDSSLTFSDQSTGDPESWSWFFEGGEPITSSEQNPTILYPDTGIFSVSLVIGKGGILDSVSWQNYIQVVDDTTTISPPNDSLTFPTVNCDATNTSGLAPLEVFFIGVATDPNGNDNEITYNWDFKDGNTATGNKTSHIFTETGSYNVELTVMDAEGNEVNCEEILIEVKPRPGAPTVSCSANPESGPAPLNVNFSVAATDPDGDPLQYFWDFGDGDTTSAQNPTHTYSIPGEYEAEITVMDEDGLVSSCKKVISVNENNLPPSLNCSITPTTGSAPLSIEAMAIAEDPDGDDEAMTYLWTFGILDSSTSSTANFTFDSAGIYQVKLTVTDEAGMTNSCEETITVSGLENQRPMASCEATPTTGEAPLTVNFTGGGQDTDGSIESYSWNFGDESPLSQLQNPTHEYTTEGTFTASLVVEDNQGAKDTCIKIITVSSNVCPQAQLQVSPLSGESPLEVNFSGALSTDSDGTITLYLWDFGDGNTAEGETATHIYQTDGQFTATLTVTDNEGCQKSTFVTINVGSNNICPQAVMVTNNQAGTAPLSIIFDGTSSTDADGLITSFVWRFGDGDTAAGPDVSHTYESAGTFTAILEITDDGGCQVSDSLVITVSSPPSPPTVNCSASPESGTAPLEVSLSASGIDSDGFIVSYNWDFGDGTSGSGENLTHTYEEGTYIAQVIVTDNDGLSDTCVAFIAVGAAPNQPPSVSCNASVLTGSPPLTINFSTLATDTDGTIASYEWTFGDGNTSIAQNPTHIYQTEGNYMAQVVATDDDGARDTCELSISVQTGVNSPPTLSCLPDKTSGKAPLTVNFSADASDSDGTIASYRWEFGDGGSSTQEDPSYTFSDAGTYNVRLVVKDNVGDSAVCTNTITVTANQCPSPSIQANPTSGVIPLEVSFDASNSTDPDGAIVSYTWNFGDGDTGMGETTSHTYTEAGNYLATLTVTDNDNCSETANISITVSSPDNTPPVASCQADETSGKAPFTVNFSGAASADADGAIAEYTWDFGDGSPISSGVTQEHTYTTPGTYSATLTVLDDDGASAQCNLEITVTENTNPIASCEVSPTSGNPPLLISVDGTNSSDPDGTVAEYLWTFGDGATSTEASTTHTFASGGDYLVRLVITDNEGAKDSCSTLVSVNNAPEAVCQVTPTEGNAPLTITVNGGSSTDIDGAISEYTWDFGDGSPARTGVSLTHEYTSEGSYTVSLTVLDDDGASGECTQVVTVSGINQLPTANCVLSPISGKNPLTVDFDGSGSTDTDGTITTYAWSFGDSGTASTASGSYIFTTAGTYQVKLVVIDNLGGKDSCEQEVTVIENLPPVAGCDISPTSGNAPISISVDGSTSSDTDGTISTYLWKFGEEATFSGAATTYEFTTPGTYEVELVVTDNDGAKDSCSQTIEVNAPPVANCNVNPTSGEAPLSVTFDGSGSTDSDGSITTYEWKLGDGTVISAQNTTHVYTTPGSYDATLIVTDDNGAVDSCTVTVEVGGNLPPNVSCSATPTSGNLPLDVSFSGSWSDPDGTVETSEWVFGNGSSSSLPNSNQTYNIAGIYNATLTVTDNDGADSVCTQRIVVISTLNPDCSDIEKPGLGNIIEFDASLSTGSIFGYLWDFGDGNTSTEISGAHRYDNPGTYLITLTIRDGFGNTDFCIREITI